MFTALHLVKAACQHQRGICWWTEASDYTPEHQGPMSRGQTHPWKSEQLGPGQEEIEKLPNQNVYFPKR